MNVLIVYARPESKSFNGAMKDLAVKNLSEAGHKIVMSDLYAMGFNPVAGERDMTGARTKAEAFSLAREQTIAYENGTLAADIKA